MSFEELGLIAELQRAVADAGYTEPTPVQLESIPPILAGRDLLAGAQTGTGKTAAYLLPVIEHIAQSKPTSIDTLIIAPTRELALQIDQQMEGFSYFTSVSSIAIYGGRDGASFDAEKKAILRGSDIIIATPGKLIQHLNLGYVDLSGLKHFILDEADRMLDMGFFEDIMRIASKLPKERQTLLFSATMPPKIRKMANNILRDPEQVNIAISKPAEGVFQAAFDTFDHQKVPLIEHLLSAKTIPSVIIFCSTKKSTKEIEKALQKLDFPVRSIHSDLDQSEREQVLLNFRNRKIQVLVATDIVSRGIDIEDIGLIVNYDVPRDAEDYVHRIGRTARAESKGVAFTFINQDDQYRFTRIEKLIERKISKGQLPESLGPGPEFKQKPFKKSSRGSFKGAGKGRNKRH